MIDEDTGNSHMRVVGQKGLGQDDEMAWLIKDVHEELKPWGHPGCLGNQIILKSDGETATVADREAIGRYHGGNITPEQPPKGEHQSNGFLEEAGRTIRDMVRVLKCQLEARLNIRLKPQDAIMQRLVRWAATSLSRYKVGQDGSAAYERQTGRRCRLEVIPFGERVLLR